jgi:hypothetical protein
MMTITARFEGPSDTLVYNFEVLQSSEERHFYVFDIIDIHGLLRKGINRCPIFSEKRKHFLLSFRRPKAFTKLSFQSLSVTASSSYNSCMASATKNR